ncbi:hypothetical protein LCGC14_0549180 [marine sediment metagenome]|uniref:Uncharacterized protein n=1 Tax=marine sediment metagenome TaxID=412755 RepID=A0A0F9RQI8_9ZZZZ
MKWETLDEDYHIEESDLFNNEHCVMELKEVQFHLEDGSITSVMIETKNGSLIEVATRETEDDGCRKQLYVSTSKGDI